jgi:hypothetical protein
MDRIFVLEVNDEWMKRRSNELPNGQVTVCLIDLQLQQRE